MLGFESYAVSVELLNSATVAGKQAKPICKQMTMEVFQQNFIYKEKAAGHMQPTCCR